MKICGGKWVESVLLHGRSAIRRGKLRIREYRYAHEGSAKLAIFLRVYFFLVVFFSSYFMFVCKYIAGSKNKNINLQLVLMGSL